MAHGDGRRPFSRVGIVGLGLIGGSVAMGVRRTWPAVRLLGVDRDDVTRRALAAGLVDEVRPGVDGLAGCDLVVLATPVSGIVDLLGTLRAVDRSVVTDVGSTKREIMAAAAAAGLTTFVGGHPMAGAAHAGWEHATAGLFDGQPWALVDASGGSGARRLVEPFVRGLGAVPVLMTADQHDRTMAYVSHLPQLLAVMLMTTAVGECGPAGLAVAGRGFRDMTRLAASPGPLWRDILESNRDYIAEALERIRGCLQPGASGSTLDVESLTQAFEQANRLAEGALGRSDAASSLTGTR